MARLPDPVVEEISTKLCDAVQENRGIFLNMLQRAIGARHMIESKKGG